MKQQGIKGLPTIPRKFTPCNACILGKHHKQSFQNSKSGATRKLSLVHSNLGGPMHVPTANGNKYILLLMIIRGCVGFICLKKKHKFLMCLRNFIS